MGTRLPDPLMTGSLLGRWTQAAGMREGVERVQEVARLVASLPPVNRAVFCEIIRLLYMVHMNFEVKLSHTWFWAAHFQ